MVQSHSGYSSSGFIVGSSPSLRILQPRTALTPGSAAGAALPDAAGFTFFASPRDGATHVRRAAATQRERSMLPRLAVRYGRGGDGSNPALPPLRHPAPPPCLHPNNAALHTIGPDAAAGRGGTPHLGSGAADGAGSDCSHGAHLHGALVREPDAHQGARGCAGLQRLRPPLSFSACTAKLAVRLQSSPPVWI